MLSSGAGALGLRAGVKRRNQRTDDACGAALCLCSSCWGQFSGPSLQYWAHGRHSLGVLFTSERHFRVIKKFLKPKIVALAYTISYCHCARRPSDSRPPPDTPPSQKVWQFGCAKHLGVAYITLPPLLRVRLINPAKRRTCVARSLGVWTPLSSLR